MERLSWISIGLWINQKILLVMDEPVKIVLTSEKCTNVDFSEVSDRSFLHKEFFHVRRFFARTERKG